MNGKCQVQNVVSNCTMSATPNFPKRVYLGVAEGDWKQRFYNHKKSIKNKSYRNDTTLSSYLWDLREKHNVFPTLTWSVVKSVPRYFNISKRCLLCLPEKVLIATYENPEQLLNKRSELMAKCRQNNKFFLSCREYSSNLPDDWKIVKRIVVNLIVIFFLKPTIYIKFFCYDNKILFWESHFLSWQKFNDKF